MSTKQVQFIDTSALSGSTEKLRTEMGQYWQIVETDYGDVPVFNASNITELAAVYLGEIYNWTSPMSYNNPYSDYLGFALIKYPLHPEGDLKTSASADTVVPNYKVPVRMYGREDNLRSDKEWKDYLLGGTLRGKSTGGIFNTKVFDTFGFSYDIPYSELESKTLHAITNGTYDSLEMTCDYNTYLPNYIQHISTLANERLIPNIYFIDIAANANRAIGGSFLAAWERVNGTGPRIPKEEFVDRTITKAVMLDYNLDWDVFQIDNAGTNTSLLPEYPTVYTTTPGGSTGRLYDTFVRTKEYLNSLVPANPLGSETSEKLSLISQNIIFDNNAINDHMINFYMLMRENWPFYNKITFNPPESDNTTYRDLITDHDYSAKFMSILKEYFLEEAAGKLITKGFLNFSEYFTVDTENSQINDSKTTENITMKSCEFVDMLMYGYNNDSPVSDNSYQIGYENESDIGSIKDIKSSLRYINTDNVLDLLNRTVDSMTEPNSYQIFNDFPKHSWRGFYALLGDDINYDETIAYRIEKIGGPPTGDSQTQNTIQNFWFFNNTDLLTFKYSDTQVKYGAEYTYNVYAYVLVAGMKYKTDDLIITRQIGSTTTTDGNGQEVLDKYCLEFYNPKTGEATEQLWTKDNTLTAENQFATTAQITDTNPYLADFNLYYEPSIKIFEVPLGTKTFRPLDSPPNSLDVIPFQKLDDSQTLGFNIKYEEFASSENGEELPPAITAADIAYLGEYRNTYDMITNSVFTETISPQTQVEVLRLSERPAAYTDFAEASHGVVDLQIENKNYYLTDEIFYDKIQTNKKYYYLFRFVNAHGISGRISTILQAELIDDGGYKYSVFKDLFDEDLDSDIFIQPSKTFKKLIHILPNLKQLMLNTSKVDFNDHAANQLENLGVGTHVNDPLWGKTFKIRLTSKKTSKKADLNLTFNLTEEP
tara:strand:- start:2229 stop:5036 length:2808 start_codon:yes stop_codon:yes gene_type:complete